MGGRRVYHARGKVLGGSSSVNGMIFQRGNPMDYERWASDPGMETWDHAHCLPYFKRMENCLAAAADDPFRGHDGPLVLERGPAKGPLFDAFFAAVQEAGYPLTDDVNGYRQEGFAAFDRNVHKGRRLSAARAYLHPVMGRPNLDVTTLAFATKIVFEGDRAVGVEYTRTGRRGSETVRAGEVIVCGGAINSPQRAAALRRRRGGRAARARHRRRGRRPRRGGAPAGPPRGLHPAHRDAARHDGAVLRDEGAPEGGARVAAAQDRPRRDEPLRGRRLRALQRGRRVPQPDVPLPADRGALRRHAAGGRRGPRLPGPRRPDVLRRARHVQDHEQGSAQEARPAVQLPLDGAGPARVGRGDPRDPRDP